MMTIFLLSLIGLPPLAGFIGKLYLFAETIKQEWYWLAIVGVVNSVISLYYYAGIVKTMFLDQPNPADRKVDMTANDSVLLGVLSSLTVVFGIYWGPLVHYTNESLRFFLK